MVKQTYLVPLALLFCLPVFAQTKDEIRPLQPGQPVEREIAGGDSHTYQISFTAGQFVCFRLQQRAIDVVLILTAPDGKQLAERNLTGLIRLGEQETLSLEAPITGSYRLTARGAEAAVQRGSYRLEAVVRKEATAQDRRRLKAETLLVEAKELSKQAGGMAPQVIEKMQQALPVLRELGEPHWTAYALSLIATAYFDLSQLGKAIEHFEQALASWREVKDRAGEGHALNYLGRASTNLGRAEKALEYYEQALAIWREVKYRRNQAVALNNLGSVYSGLGRTEKTIEYYEQALSIAREIKDRAEEGRTLNNLGIVYRNLGRNEEALEYSDQALAIAREVRNQAHESTALNNLGIVYTVLSRYEKAIEYYEQALGISREVKNRIGEGYMLINLGRVYSWLGRTEKAIEYYEQALAIYREVKNQANEGTALLNLGNAYSDLGRTEKAIEYYEQALAIAREVTNRVVEGSALLNLGNAYSDLGRTEKTIEYYERALAIYREVKNRIGEGDTLINLGYAHRSLGRLDEAVKYHEQGLLIARELKSQTREAGALTQLATDERERGNLVRARTLIEESLAISESVRTKQVGNTPENRAGFLATVQSSYQLYTDLLMRQHQVEPTKGLDALALETSERQRARSLLDLLAQASIDVREGVDASLLEREREVGLQLNNKAQELTQAIKLEEAAGLKKEISRLESEYERAQAAIRKASPHYAALTQPQPLRLKEIQQQLDPDTMLLEYALGSEHSYLWAITKDALKSYALPKEAQINPGALRVHQLLTARSTNKRGESAAERQRRITKADADLPEAAAALSQMLLGPVAAELGKKRLVIVADGALQYVPFAMLPEPVGSGRLAVGSRKKTSNQPKATNYQPLIVGHEVVSLPSASALAIQRTDLAGRQPAPKMLAVIADPVFDRTDARFATPVNETSDKTEAQTIAADDERSIEHLAEKAETKTGGATVKLVIPRLTYTGQEAEKLLALAPGGASFRALGFEANRTTALDPVLGQYRYLHFATHGYLDTERPGLSSLVLSMVDEKGQRQNGFLRANDIYNLKLPAELVVLSACQTGLGKEIKGEGLIGLTRGFMYAGAARVVVSLWNVNDKATAGLMAKFYEKMLKQGQRPAAALRAAQVEMWKQKQWQSPYYWAAFTMQGEWR